MEQLPSTYQGREEEDIRDYLLTVLSSHFENATGETFNVRGKTDIYVRDSATLILIGECKYWSGRSDFLKTIDQVLSYLTWRDSRAAIFMFVRNKNLGPVLDEIKAAAPQHRCCVATEPEMTEGWYPFTFHMAEDSTRSVRLAIQCFHFPPGTSQPDGATEAKVPI
jgi:hypothetical protein